jgi:hypothetical protein
MKTLDSKPPNQNHPEEVLTFQHFEQCLKEAVDDNYEPKISEFVVGGNKYIRAATKDVPSKLPKVLVKLTRTPSFKKWFGDWVNDPNNASKLVDPETQEPQFVHHGVEEETDPTVGPFLRSWSPHAPHLSNILYTATRAQDAKFWSEYASKNGKPFDTQIYGAFLNIRRPIVVDSHREIITRMKDENIRSSKDGIIQRTGEIDPAVDPSDQFAVFDNRNNIMWVPIVLNN